MSLRCYRRSCDDDPFGAVTRLRMAGRVLALKALCEARLERDDCRGRVEDAIRPCKETRAAAKLTGVLPSVDDFRRNPLGSDSSGLDYYYFVLHLSNEGAWLPALTVLDLNERLASLPLIFRLNRRSMESCRYKWGHGLILITSSQVFVTFIRPAGCSWAVAISAPRTPALPVSLLDEQQSEMGVRWIQVRGGCTGRHRPT